VYDECKTSNLSKARVTRDSIGATIAWAMYRVQQCNKISLERVPKFEAFARKLPPWSASFCFPALVFELRTPKGTNRQTDRPDAQLMWPLCIQELKADVRIPKFW